MWPDRNTPSGGDLSDPANWSRPALEEAAVDYGMTWEEARSASRSFLVEQARELQRDTRGGEFDFGGGF